MKEELFEHLKQQLSRTDIPDASLGWQQMRTLLDSPAHRGPVTLYRWWYAAAACLVIGFSTWALTHVTRPGGPGQAVVAVEAGDGRAPVSGGGVAATGAAGAESGGTSAPSDRGAAVSAGEAGAALSGVASLATAPEPGSKGALANGALIGNSSAKGASLNDASSNGAPRSSVRTSTPSETLQNMPASGRSVAFETRYALALSGGNPDQAPFDLGSPDAITQTSPLVSAYLPLLPTVGPVHPSRHSRWGFQVGLGANLPGSFRTVTMDNQKKWKAGVFPEFIASYRLDKRVSIKVGVAGPSPVAYSRTLTHTSLNVLRDSTSGRFNQTVTQTQKLGRLTYVDIPASVEWAVVPHFSLEGGVQYSHLLTQQDDTHSIKVPSAGFMPYVQGSAQPGAGPQDQTHVHKADVRWLLGANFHWRRLSAGVQYQGGLLRADNQSDEQGNTIENRTSIARMQVMYSLR